MFFNRFANTLLCAVVLLTVTLSSSHGINRSAVGSNEIAEQQRSVDIVQELNGDESEDDEFCEWMKCDNYLAEPTGIRKYLDLHFLKKLARNLNPFSSPSKVMRFYLFRREFRDCGREMSILDDSLLTASLDPNKPTRIIIHGWMSQSRGSFNRDVKNAYLDRGDFNVIVTDWSVSASNPNYFAVTKMIEVFGAQLARFTERLHSRLGVQFDDIYLIGHSLGAQIAGAAGKRIRPEQYNTIFALDPAGPTFRHRDDEFRIDPTDARYVESIQTSANLGFLEPRGNATFYPNRGVIQRNCYIPGCSHTRAYKMFAESINSPNGFWGTHCERDEKGWECISDADAAAEVEKASGIHHQKDGDTGSRSKRAQQKFFRMAGEPSVPKSGLFYVKTNDESPFALGKEA